MPFMVMIRPRAITTLGVPDPRVMRKSGILRPLTRVRCSRYAMVKEITIPMVAAAAAKVMELMRLSIMSSRPKILVQCMVVKLLASKSPLPRFFLTEVVAMVIKGMMITMMENRLTSTVVSPRHLPRSTILGRVDLPETVMYCLRATTTSEI